VSDISSGFWEWIKLEKMVKLIPVVAFLLAATINPFKGESHDLMIEVLHPAEVAQIKKRAVTRPSSSQNGT